MFEDTELFDVIQENETACDIYYFGESKSLWDLIYWETMRSISGNSKFRKFILELRIFETLRPWIEQFIN